MESVDSLWKLQKFRTWIILETTSYKFNNGGSKLPVLCEGEALGLHNWSPALFTATTMPSICFRYCINSSRDLVNRIVEKYSDWTVTSDAERANLVWSGSQRLDEVSRFSFASFSIEGCCVSTYYILYWRRHEYVYSSVYSYSHVLLDRLFLCVGGVVAITSLCMYCAHIYIYLCVRMDDVEMTASFHSQTPQLVYTHIPGYPDAITSCHQTKEEERKSRRESEGTK